MANPFFRFKQFTIHHDRCAMKVTTDACLFGAWIANQLQEAGNNGGEILEIGTGSGLLALMIAQKSTAHILAVEKDPSAGSQAVENINTTPWANRIVVQIADINQFSSAPVFDRIICNPPFYENELKSPAGSRNVAMHDSALLLDDLLQLISKNLKTDGIFYLLLPYKRHAELNGLFNRHGLMVRRKVLVRQSDEHDYFRVMIAGSNKYQPEIAEESSEISIRGLNGEYSTGFVALLRDYYLYL